MTAPAERPPSPLDDPDRWMQIVESVGVESMLVVIHRRMGSRLLACCSPEDIWQQTLAHAWRDRARFRWDGTARFRAWLLAIADHRIHDELDRIHAQKREGEVGAQRFSELEASHDRAASSFLPGITTTPERLAYYCERARIMRDALTGLPQDCEPLVRGHLFEEEPIESIAAALGISRTTAYARFRRGAELYAQRLRELLADSDLKGSE